MNAENHLEDLVKHLSSLIVGGNAHVTFDESIENLAPENFGIKPPDLPYSIWMLVQHIRITQADILDFSVNKYYKPLKWPDEYWPAQEAPTDTGSWQNCLDKIQDDRQNFIDLLHKPDADLFAPFRHGDGQNLFKEALLIADHTSYHTGQIVLIRRLLNDWNN